jgi:hypothetical protein
LWVISESWLFHAVHDYRCWKNQQIKYLTLILGFALVCGLLACTLRLGQMLFIEPPQWVGEQQRYITILRTDDGGRALPVSKRVLQSLDDLPGVKATSYLHFSSIELTSDSNALPSMAAVYFEPDLPRQLGIPELAGNDHDARRSIWLSQRAFDEMFGANTRIIGSTLYSEHIPYPLVLAGVLPSKFDQVGSYRPAVWIDARNLVYLTPFRMPEAGQPNPDQETRVRQFLEKMPMLHGLAVLDPDADAGALQAALRTVHESHRANPEGMIRVLDDGSAMQIFAGINIDPTAQRALKHQWSALLVLLMILAAVLTVNSLTLFAAHWIARMQELNTMLILGAGPRDLFRLMLAGFLPAAGLAILLSLWLTIGLVFWVGRTETYQNWAGAQPFTISIAVYSIAVALSILLLFLCRGLPLIMLINKARFTRKVGAARSAFQYLFDRIALTVQSASALLVFSIAGAISVSEWQLQASLPINLNSVEIQVNHRDIIHTPVGLEHGRFPNLPDLQTAASTYPMISQGMTFEVSFAGLEHPIPVSGRHVSSNYFEVAGVPVAGKPSGQQRGVIINQALHQRLKLAGEDDSLIGRSLRLSAPWLTAYPIIGVVENLPHRGLANRESPAIYLPLQDADFFRSLTLLTEPDHADQLADAAREWAQQALHEPRVTAPRRLETALQEVDRLRTQLLVALLAIGLVLLAVIFLGLLYQIRARLALRRPEFGVHAALGAPPWRLALFAMQDGITSLILALPLALLGQWSLLHFLGAELPLTLFNLAILPLATLAFLALLMLATIQPLLDIKRQSLSALLRQDA